MAGKSDRNERAASEGAEKSTKERIVDVSIDLFAQKGFDAVSMQEIADAVGIKKASLYYHFASKDQILEAALKYPMERLSTIGARAASAEEQITAMGVEGFLELSQGVVLEWMDSPYVEKILRIIFVEMYHNEQIKAYFGEAVLKAASVFWTDNFRIMMKHKLIRPSDPEVLMAEYLSFYSHTWMEFFLYRYGKTDGSYRQEYEDQLSRHTAFIASSIKA